MAAHSHLRLAALAAALSCGAPPEPGATSTPPAAEVRATQSVGGLQGRRTRVRGVVADLVSAERAGNVLVVTLRFRNSAQDTLPLPVSPGLEGAAVVAGGRTWPLARNERGAPRAGSALPESLAPAETRVWRGEFAAPPPEVETFDLEIPGVDRFTAVPIRDRGP